MLLLVYIHCVDEPIVLPCVTPFKDATLTNSPTFLAQEGAIRMYFREVKRISERAKFALRLSVTIWEINNRSFLPKMLLMKCKFVFDDLCLQNLFTNRELTAYFWLSMAT